MQKIDNSGGNRWWLLGAMTVASFYSALALRVAFQFPNLVQDDARQHVFWMARFRDPTLFPNDLMTDYFQAVAPAGYKAFYWMFAKLGVDPLLLSKILPAAIGIVTACFAFRLFVRLTDNPRGAFFASVIVSQLIWFKDDVVSATPRAFVYPLFLAFLLFLVERRLVASLLMLTLQGLFYPQAALVSLGILGLGIIGSRDRRDYVLPIAGFILVTGVLLLFRSSMEHFGPTITPGEARALPEFQEHGRSVFFIHGLDFWLTGARSGFWPGAIPTYLTILGFAGAALLILPIPIAAVEKLRRQRGLLLRIVVAALVMWSFAHLLLFKLHLPSRYSHWAIRMVLAMTGAVAIMAFFAIADKLKRNRAINALLVSATVVLVVAPLFYRKFPSQTYVQAKPPELFEFLRTQPKTFIVATLRESASKIPVFAHRSVLVSAEHAIPYHLGYYREIRRRGRDLVAAHLTPDPNELRTFIEKYHVDLLIVGRSQLDAQNIKNLRWFGEIMTARELDERFADKRPAALAAFIDQAKLWEGERDIVLDARLIAQTIAGNENAR